MEIYPRHIGDRLGFETIRERLTGLASCPAGAARLKAMVPLPFDQAERELDMVSALQALREAGASLPEALFDPIDDLVAAARPRGAFLDPEGLLEIRRLCVTGDAVLRFLRQGDEPALRAPADRMMPAAPLATAIDDVLEPDGSVKDSASDALRGIRRDLRAAQAQVRRALQKALREASGQGWAVEDQPTVRAGRMVIPVRAEAKRKLGGIVHDVSSTGQTVFVEPAESVELNNEVRELEGAERREIIRILTRLTDRVRESADDLLQNQAILTDFDVWRAKALLAVRLKARRPDREDNGVIVLNQARNPELLLLKDAAEAVVPLTLTLGNGHSMLVISGPNAGGKSVAMKTVGLIAYMLHCGIPVPVGPESRFDRFDRIMADIGDEQSVEDDLSTFSSRLARTRDMTGRADRRTLVLIDEAGTGTDPQEGAALAQAALEMLSEAGARIVVTTHHAALKLFAHASEEAVNAMMRFDEETLRPTYVLEMGVPGASYAFEIAGRMGLPESLVTRGKAILGEEHVSMERLLSDLQTRNSELEEEIDRQRREARKSAEQRKLLEQRLEALSGARDQIKEKALSEADRILGGVNAEVERAIREIKESQARPETVRSARERLADTKERVQKARKKTLKRKAAREEPEPAPPSGAGPLRVGDQVRIGTDGPAGEVIELDDREAVVAIGPAHSRVKTGRLVKVGGPRKQKVTVSARTEPAAARLRVDVRGMRSLEAVTEVERFVDEALSAGLNRAEILHGKGTGALRTSIHEYLGSRSDIGSYDEAPVDQGGAGVTVVSF